MKFFNRKNNKSNDNYVSLSNWLDTILDHDLPEGIIAFNFNLYEGSKGTYDVQLIGSNEFDEDDSDWVCTDYFTTGENICYIPKTKDIEKWEDGLSYISKLVEQYLFKGKKANILKSASAIGIGFVDGDINILHKK